jgi:4,5-DOPA dioxygenase extradiol
MTMDRRGALKVLAHVGVEAMSAPALSLSMSGCIKRPDHQEKKEPAMSPSADKPSAARMPTVFLAHGSPILLTDRPWMSELNLWASHLPRPKAILMLSAHWLDKPVTLGATTPVPLVYDFSGFPAEFYQTKYPAPPAPALAARVRALLGPGQTVDEPERGLDHGAYVPLVAMYPGADVPVLQASLPSLEPTDLLKLGQALAPLRDEGVLIVGSGFLTHNLRRMSFEPNAPTPQWAAEFDAWTADALVRKDVDALMKYREKAPGVRESLPTHEHFVPVIVALGAALADAPAVTFPITGWAYGSGTKRSVQFGAAA